MRHESAQIARRPSTPIDLGAVNRAAIRSTPTHDTTMIETRVRYAATSLRPLRAGPDRRVSNTTEAKAIAPTNAVIPDRDNVTTNASAIVITAKAASMALLAFVDANHSTRARQCGPTPARLRLTRLAKRPTVSG